VISEPHKPATTDRLCCLHIGMPKTATKTMQMSLFAQHQEVDYLGTYTGAGRKYFRQCRTPGIQQLMSELIWDRIKTPDLDAARILYQEEVAPSLANGKVPVWSWESLMENRPEVQRQRAENLRAVFGPCKIIATLRHPITLIESLYLQLLKRDNVGGYSGFGKPMRYQPIDRWIDDQWDAIGDAPKAHLEYANTIETFADVFGKENVGVFLFEQLTTNPQAYYEGICNFIGIDPQEAMSHVGETRKNERWTDTQLERLDSIHRSLWKSTLFRFSPRVTRRKMLGLPGNTRGIPPQGSRGATLSIAPHLAKKIQDKTREGNRHLQEQWGLPMEDFQYPV